MSSKSFLNQDPEFHVSRILFEIGVSSRSSLVSSIIEGNKGKSSFDSFSDYINF